MALQRPLESLSDDEILDGLTNLLRQSRRCESDLVAHIAAVETRRLYARVAAPSLFAYCTDILHLSEGESYLRITAAQVARQHPIVLEMLADGRLHLSGIAKLDPYLTGENRDRLLSRAIHKSKREIELLIAETAPRPDAPSIVRRLPTRPTPPHEEPVGVTVLPIPDGVAEPPTPATAVVVEPLSPARYRVQFTAGAELHDKLERLRGLLRHEVPDGDLAAIIDRAVTREVARLEARRYAQTSSARTEPARTSPARSSRHIPASVRRQVYRRDGGRCCFVDKQGRRCPEHHRLEYHHRHPFGFGGGHDIDNVCLMCKAHNRLIAEIDYGSKLLSRHRESKRRMTFACST